MVSVEFLRDFFGHPGTMPWLRVVVGSRASKAQVICARKRVGIGHAIASTQRGTRLGLPLLPFIQTLCILRLHHRQEVAEECA